MTDTTTFHQFIGKTVVDAKLKDSVLRLVFHDGAKADIYDDGQQCCESRWMTSDDDVHKIIGGVFYGLEENIAGSDESEGDEDQMFVSVQTSVGSMTLCTHNEHNGYYGGFDVVMTRA